jgi:hypothetical protein
MKNLKRIEICFLHSEQSQELKKLWDGNHHHHMIVMVIITAVVIIVIIF